MLNLDGSLLSVGSTIFLVNLVVCVLMSRKLRGDISNGSGAIVSTDRQTDTQTDTTKALPPLLRYAASGKHFALSSWWRHHGPMERRQAAYLGRDCYLPLS